jgi:hypothetical protein
LAFKSASFGFFNQEFGSIAYTIGQRMRLGKIPKGRDSHQHFGGFIHLLLSSLFGTFVSTLKVIFSILY